MDRAGLINERAAVTGAGQHARLGRNLQAGFTLLELIIAGLVLTVGLLGSMVLILTAVANDSRDKNDSSATILSQMTTEMIASVPANSSASVTITDCNPASSSASHTISTTGNSTGAGAPLTSGGAIDFTQAQVTNYSMLYYGCQASTGDRQTVYDVRWYVKTISADAKLVVVAAEPIAGNTHSNYLAVPVSLRTIVGL